MKKNITSTSKIINLTLLVLAFSGAGIFGVMGGEGQALATYSDEYNEKGEITICHATESEEHPWNELHVSENASNGHFDENGTPEYGHEEDLLLNGNESCPDAPDEEVYGSITVCKIVLNSEGNVSDGNDDIVGSFSIGGVHEDDVPLTNFSYPLTLNKDILFNDDILDAQCVSYDDLDIQNYEYDEEVIVGDGWESPLYNDQYTVDIVDLDDFFTYSSDDSNHNSDGDINLKKNRTNRTLVILNQIKETQSPECSDGLNNDDDILVDTADPGCWADPDDPYTYDPDDDDENEPPVITLRGDATVSLFVGETYNEDEADVDDPEEGDIDGKLVIAGDTVDTNTVGTYTVTYNAQDTPGLAADEVTRTVNVTEEPQENATINATKVVCDAEEFLPNWGTGGADITSTTATDWVAQSQGRCALESDWEFEWGYQNVTNPGDAHYGVAGGDWNTFGPTDSNGVATVDISDLNGSSHLWFREVLKEGYIPFTFGPNGSSNSDNESAEIYCGSDVLNYDNFDRIDNIALDETFYCVAFNTLIDTPPPVDNSCPFEAQTGRIIIDFEDGDKILDSGDIYSYKATNVPAGTYKVSLASFDGYTNRSDTNQLYEIWKLKLRDGGSTIATSDVTADLADDVDFVAASYVVNNELVVGADADGAKAWHGVAGEGKDTANSVEPVCAALDLVVENQKPVITIGDATLILIVGDTFTEDATATDLEDGNIPFGNIVIVGSVNTAVVGTYNLTYDVDDSEGLAADQVTREVIVRNKPADPKQCSDDLDNDNDGFTDEEDPGCHTDGDPDNPYSYDPDDDDETHVIPYAPYCGDNEVNQVWEVCDAGLSGDTQCTAQCQNANQCIELAFARVNTNEFENHNNGDITDDVFLGSNINKIPGGAWFLLYNTGTYVSDVDASGYEDVPGLAVERQEGSVRVVAYGSHPNDGSKEHINGDVEFFNFDVTEPTSDDSGNNRLEGEVPNAMGSMDNVPGDDEVWLKSGNDTQSFFWLTTTVADDGFFSNYGEEVPMCVQPNQKPVITLELPNPLEVDLFGTYIDPGATALDHEDGDITNPQPDGSGGTFGGIVVGGQTVDPNTVGTYLVTYDVSDSEGLDADTETRTVHVVDNRVPTECNDDGFDNDGDQVADENDPGCWTDPEDPDTYDPNDDDENEIPVITLRGDSVQNIVLDSTYTEESADVDDAEDGDIDGNLVIAGDVVDTATLGVYTVTYNAIDSALAAAVEVTRTVNVIEEGDQNEIPVITLIGNASVSLNKGGTYTDEGATANDTEDGDITGDIVTVNGVDTNTPGTYTVTYNVDDSNGAAAVEVTRTVTVVDPGTPSCTSNCGGGGGGGHIPDGLKIFNEKITVIGEGTALITWNTNKAATSRVVYDDDAHTVSVSTLNFGTGSENLDYEFTTDIVPALNTEHSVLVTNVNLEDLFYFRPISSDGTRAIGIELEAVLGVVTGGSCEQYLLEFIKFGDNNNANEVLKLQTFLNDFEGANLEVTGVYNEATFAAVVAFQNKYNGDVLSPWGLQTDTGYVYLTTRKKINEIYCNFQLEFPLTNDQLAEVNQFKGLLEGLEAQGLPLPDTSNVGVAPSAPTFAGGDTDPNVTLTEETTGEDNSDSLAAALEAVNGGAEGGIFSRIGNFFRNLLR